MRTQNTPAVQPSHSLAAACALGESDCRHLFRSVMSVGGSLFIVLALTSAAAAGTLPVMPFADVPLASIRGDLNGQTITNQSSAGAWLTDAHSGTGADYSVFANGGTSPSVGGSVTAIGLDAGGNGGAAMSTYQYAFMIGPKEGASPSGAVNGALVPVELAYTLTSHHAGDSNGAHLYYFGSWGPFPDIQYNGALGNETTEGHLSGQAAYGVWYKIVLHQETVIYVGSGHSETGDFNFDPTIVVGADWLAQHPDDTVYVATSVPEPSTLLSLAGGLIGLGATRRRRTVVE